MRRSPVALAGALAMLLAAPVLAQTYYQSYLGYKMFPWPLQYWLDDKDPSPGLSTNVVAQTTQQSFNTWAQVPCSWARFTYMGLVSTNGAITNPKDSQDPYSVSTIWIGSSSDPYYSYALGGGTNASAAVPLTYAGGLYACDIYLNSFDFAWSTQTPTPANVADLQTFLMHEVGHCMGLGDTNISSNDVMFSTVPLGAQHRTLQQDDLSQVCYYYPQGGYGSPCSAGSPCNTAANPNLKCISPDGGTGNTYCSTGCAYSSTANSCDIPFVCQPSTLISGSSGACLPGTGSQTAVGNPCTADNQCGSASGRCLLPQAQPDGTTFWANGYCTQDCTSTPCPAGSVCYSVGGVGQRCLKTCTLGATGCRLDYACSPLAGLDAGTAACVSACQSDQDCGSNMFCRTCDGVCLFRQGGTGQIGDPCTSASDCGTGQVCLTFGGSTGVCSQQCSTGCGGCPQGSSCLPAGFGGVPYCLRNCQIGTCQSGQMCGTVGPGQGCMPACASDVNCPSGQRCSFGQCYPTTADGGSCVLCYVGAGDGGVVSNGAPDSGIGDARAGGCGCQGAGGPAAAILSLLLVFTLAGARRRCPPR